MKKLISTLLLISVLASMAACGGEAQTDTETTLADDTTAAETSPDNIPLGTNLNGATVKIYVRGDTIDTEFDNAETGDVVDDAVYNRNRAIEERLNVKLEYMSNTSLAFWADRNIYMDTVRSSVLANDGSIDIAAGLSNIMPNLAQDGMFINLLGKDVPYLNFDSPWWPAELTEELSVKGRLYMASGEACLGVIKGMMCFYFNKDMVEKNKLENPYDLVTDGKWTLDRMAEMASSVYADLNGNAEVDNEDQFGFWMTNENHAPNFLLASGLRLTQPDANGLPEYALGSEKIVSLVDKLGELFSQEGLGTIAVGQSTNDVQSFIDGRCLFITGEFNFAETFRDMKFDFGILPYPKYDEAQSEYISSSRATYSLFGILVTADADNCAAVLEALASENYRTVTPAYYEKALKVKYSRDDISSQMFDLIKGHISFDYGVVHGPMIENISTTLRWAICYPSGSWATTWASWKDAVKASNDKYLEAIMSLPE